VSGGLHEPPIVQARCGNGCLVGGCWQLRVLVGIDSATDRPRRASNAGIERCDRRARRFAPPDWSRDSWLPLGQLPERACGRGHHDQPAIASAGLLLVANRHGTRDESVSSRTQFKTIRCESVSLPVRSLPSSVST